MSGGYRYEGEEFATYVRLLTLYCEDNDSLFTLFPFDQFIGRTKGLLIEKEEALEEVYSAIRQPETPHHFTTNSTALLHSYGACTQGSPTASLRQPFL